MHGLVLLFLLPLHNGGANLGRDALIRPIAEIEQTHSLHLQDAHIEQPLVGQVRGSGSAYIS